MHKLQTMVLDTSRRQSKVKFNLKMHGGEITRLGGDFDSILVASLLVASLHGGEMTSYHLFLLELGFLCSFRGEYIT